MYNQRKQWIERFRQEYIEGVLSYEDYTKQVAEVDQGLYDDVEYIEPVKPEPQPQKIFYGFDQNKETYRKQRKLKPLLVILTIVIAVTVLSTIGGMIGTLNYEVYEWPANNETAQMIPQPQGDLTYISVYDGDYLYATVKLQNDRDCEDYIVECMQNGFIYDKESSQYENFYDFSAKNAEGWEVNVYNYDREMHISLYSPTWLQKIDTVETKVALPENQILPEDVYQEDW